MTRCLKLSLLIVGAIFATTQQYAHAEMLTVLGTANIFGSGHSAPGDTPEPGGGGGGTPAPFIVLNGATLVTFPSITGAVDFGGGGGLNGPEGFSASPYTLSPFNGISGITLDRVAPLVGVFVGASEPADPAPDSLNFVGSTSFSSLSPLLNQVFFIGDGLTGTGDGALQEFIVPIGATRLYLGLADADSFGNPGQYGDNSGEFSVIVNAVPEPSALVITGIGGLISFGIWRLRGCAAP